MFGKDNSQQLQGISDQLTQALRELAALRQQVDNQQHAIDRGEAITRDHLNDTREVVRRALGENRETLVSQLSAISSDLATIRANTQPYDSGPHETEAGDGHQGDGERRTDGHPQLLLAAAGISAAELHAHRDTWAFLVEHAGQDRHFHIPGGVQEEGGAVTVKISGPTLVAALTSLRTVHQAPGAAPGTAAIAEHLYRRIADTVEAVARNPRSTNGKPVIIVIDDRTADDDSDGPPAGSED